MTNERLEYAMHYIGLGWSPIPLKPMTKNPLSGFKWSTQHVGLQDVKTYFSPPNNIGIALGERSGGLVDIDFDSPYAATIGRKMFANLPGFGRKSSPLSHKVAMCPNPGKTQQFKLTAKEAEVLGNTPGEKDVVVELRGNGSYTMFPPSMHPDIEQILWHHALPDIMPSMRWEELQQLVGLCAFLAVILRMYPESAGARDAICLALAGTLLRKGMEVDEVDDWIEYIAEQKGDEEAQKRRKAEGSKKKLDAKEEVTGLPALCELLGISEMKDALQKWLGSSPDSGGDDDKVEELNSQFFVVGSEGSKCRVVSFEDRFFEKGQTRKVMTLQSFEDFRNRLRNQKVQIGTSANGTPQTKRLGDYWLDHPNRRQFDQIVFFPGGQVPPNHFNLWRGFSCEPKKGSWRRMQRHIWRVLAQRDRASFRYIIRWAAWAVQNPGEPAEVALVFRGGKGTGKGTFCRWVKNLFGQHGLQIFSSRHISGRFNSHLRDCVLLYADEAIAPNDRDSESTLKGMLTEPSIPIEGKGRDVVTSPNHLHVMMSSNEGWVVPASPDERRFAAFDVSDEMVRDKGWFSQLHTEMDNGGAEAMLYFLENLDLKDWHPRDNIPANNALNDQRIKSLQGMDKLWFDWLWSGEVEGVASGKTFRIQTKVFAKLTGGTQTAAGIYLKEMECQHNRNVRPTHWATPTLAEARRLWDKKRFKVEWNDIEEWMVQEALETPF